MLRLIRLSPADAADPAKLLAFQDELNAIETEGFDAELLCKIDVNVPPDGSYLGVVMYAIHDALKGGVRPALASEVKKKIDRSVRDRLRGGTS